MINQRGDHYCYLNRAPAGAEPGFASKLVQLLLAAGQAKAPPAQWAQMIKALPQKGLKAAELEDSGILARLGVSQEKTLTREEVAQMASHGLPTIKEIQLSRPQYRDWAHAGGAYKELLYVLNSARDNVDDEILEIEQQMQDLQLDASSLAMDLGVLMDDPDLPDRMQKRLVALHEARPVSWTYQNMPHFKDKLAPEDKNVMAHARITERGKLFFVEEIQSDWAQGIGRQLRDAVKTEVTNFVAAKIGRSAFGRPEVVELLRGEKVEIDGISFDPKDPELLAAAEAGKQAAAEAQRSSGRNYDHVPYVNSTEAWAGLVLRRLLQRAAADPQVEQFAWITQSMRNGGRTGGGESLDQFYKTILPKLADRLLKPAGGKVEMGQVTLGGATYDVPQIKITPAIREALRGPMPLYSLSPVWAGARNGKDEVNRVLGECERMMGSSRHVRVLDKLVDIATGRQVAGKYVNSGIVLSARATSLDRAAHHETYHFAEDMMLTEAERAVMARAFGVGQPLALRTRHALIELGEIDAAMQCNDPGECAAHAFALWSDGRLEIEEPAPRTIFEGVRAVFRDLGRWLRATVSGSALQTPDSIFKSLASGELAELRLTNRGSPERLVTSRESAFRELDVEHELPRGVTQRG